MALINLKEILSTDSDADILDKINYNFDQVANRSSDIGPVGDQGIPGHSGPQGDVGIQGPQGNIGPQGDDGVSGIGNSEWTANEYINIGGDNKTFKLAPTHIYNYQPSTIVLGHPDTTSAAFDNINDDAQLKIYKNSMYDTDIRFTSVSSPNYFDISYSDSGTMSLGFNIDNNAQNILYLKSANLFLTDLADNNMLSITPLGITLNTDMLFDSSVVSLTGSLALNFDSPAIDKIACSSDSEGTVVWKELSELLHSVPIGTIVPILPSVLMDDDNFVVAHGYTISDTISSSMYTGRGEMNTAYEGWYICNGKTWSNPNGSINHDVPDLNSYQYSILSAQPIPGNSVASSNVGQLNATVAAQDQSNVVMSSKRISSTSEMDGSVFNVNMSYAASSSTNNLYIGDENADSQNHTMLKIVSLPYIIYLGVKDLVWSDSGMVHFKMIRVPCLAYGSYGSQPPSQTYADTYVHNSALTFMSDYGVKLVDGWLRSTTDDTLVNDYAYSVIVSLLGQSQEDNPSNYGFRLYHDVNAQAFTPSTFNIYPASDSQYWAVGNSGNLYTLTTNEDICN